MRIEITDNPKEEDEEFVISQTRAFNTAFTEQDVKSLCVFARNEQEKIIGGLTGKTYWQYLEVSFLWVSSDHRNSGFGSLLINTAEAEALKRGCKYAILDTFSFQALGFYQKLGYKEFGSLSDFSGKHERHYLFKALL